MHSVRVELPDVYDVVRVGARVVLNSDAEREVVKITEPNQTSRIGIGGRRCARCARRVDVDLPTDGRIMVLGFFEDRWTRERRGIKRWIYVALIHVPTRSTRDQILAVRRGARHDWSKPGV